MQVHVKLYGPFSLMTGQKQFSMDIRQADISVEDFLGVLSNRMPRLGQVFNGSEMSRVLRSRMFLVINGSPCNNPNDMINDGDQVQVLTPVAGG